MHTFTFRKIGKNAEVETRRLATFVAQLTIEGVTFEVREDDVSVEVTLTGGF